MRIWRKANPDKVRASNVKHKKSIRAATKKWKKANRKPKSTEQVLLGILKTLLHTDLQHCKNGHSENRDKYGQCKECHRVLRSASNRSASKRRKNNPERSAWYGMLRRCYDSSFDKFRWYGGANPPVTVCERWQTYENWLQDMGVKPSPGHSNGRRGDVGSYKPGNAWWMTSEEQQETKRIKRLATAA
jgi:hypothetical protein